MEKLIGYVFIRIKDIFWITEEDHFDIVDSEKDDVAILPQLWNSSVQGGSELRLRIYKARTTPRPYPHTVFGDVYSASQIRSEPIGSSMVGSRPIDGRSHGQMPGPMRQQGGPPPPLQRNAFIPSGPPPPPPPPPGNQRGPPGPPGPPPPPPQSSRMEIRRRDSGSIRDMRRADSPPRRRAEFGVHLTGGRSTRRADSDKSERRAGHIDAIRRHKTRRFSVSVPEADDVVDKLLSKWTSQADGSDDDSWYQRSSFEASDSGYTESV